MTDREQRLDRSIGRLLARLRWRIRAYVWLEGLALAVIWLGLTFWLGLALDYLPVLAGASEMPRWARAVLLLLIAAVLVWILYRWILRRALVRLPDRSMAVLLERRFRGFDDGLVTAVELIAEPGHAEHFDRQMLQHTADAARENTASVQLRRVFNYRPLAVSSLLALLMVASIAGFYATSQAAMTTWLDRLYLLGDEPWPRKARIEVVGAELLAPEDAPQLPGQVPLIRFDEQRRLKVAKGSNIRLRVRADKAFEVPEACSMHYRTADGERGRVTMNRLRRSRGEFQDYAFNGKPLRGILASVSFDVVGYDYRARDYAIEIVDSPALIGIEADCRFPDYMVDQERSLRLPRTIELTNATQLPRGTELVIRGRTNKPLERVDLFDPESGELLTLNIDGDPSQRQHFEHHVPSLDANLTLEVTLHDVDRVVTQRPYRIFVTALPDEPPRVEAVLDGIGTAVTPDVILPISGTITDDYAVDRTWFDFEVQQAGATPESAHSFREKYEFQIEDDGRAEAALDFRLLRAREHEPIELRPNDKLAVAIQAADRYDLEGNPNVGSGDRYQLDVVTPDALLTILESREIGIRRRFEQIIQEMTQARDFLNRVVAAAATPEPLELSDPEDAADDQSDPQQAAQRAQSLRLLRTQQALQQTRKSAQELLGVANAFHAIRQELINNRVDTEDRKRKLKEDIADPVQSIGETMFPELDGHLERLDKKLSEALSNKQFDPQIGDAEAVAAVDQANRILEAMEEILKQMRDLETFNELLDIVRQLIDDQQRLIERTEAERKQGLLRDLQ